jgi:hypothetical protein
MRATLHLIRTVFSFQKRDGCFLLKTENCLLKTAFTPPVRPELSRGPCSGRISGRRGAIGAAPGSSGKWMSAAREARHARGACASVILNVVVLD